MTDLSQSLAGLDDGIDVLIEQNKLMAAALKRIRDEYLRAEDHERIACQALSAVGRLAVGREA